MLVLIITLSPLFTSFSHPLRELHHPITILSTLPLPVSGSPRSHADKTNFNIALIGIIL